MDFVLQGIKSPNAIHVGIIIVREWVEESGIRKMEPRRGLCHHRVLSSYYYSHQPASHSDD